MIETILLSFIFCKIKGYDMGPLFKSKEIYPLVACEMVYWIFQLSVYLGNYTFVKYMQLFQTIYICSCLFLVIRCSLYKNAIVGILFILAGGWCNEIAIKANNGKMPGFPTLSYITGYVKPESIGVVDQLHILGGPETKLKFLTDIFDVGYNIVSIGDLLIRVYVLLILVGAIKYFNMQKRQLSVS